MTQIIWNGRAFPADQPLLTGENRAAAYGDGLFETLRVVQGRIPLWPAHWQRLNLGMQFLQLEEPPHWTSERIQREILDSCAHPNARVRLSVLRRPGGHYWPESNLCDLMIQIQAMTDPRFHHHPTGLDIGLYEGERIPLQSRLANLKTCNALPYVLAGLFGRENDWDEVLVLNTAGRIAEASYHNVFALIEGELITPPLSESPTAGVMRKTILRLASAWDRPVRESPLKVEAIRSADEIWLTNAVRGIQWVRQFEGQTYTGELARQMTDRLNELL